MNSRRRTATIIPQMRAATGFMFLDRADWSPDEAPAEDPYPAGSYGRLFGHAEVLPRSASGEAEMTRQAMLEAQRPRYWRGYRI